jgi:hypothetical protein
MGRARPHHNGVVSGWNAAPGFEARGPGDFDKDGKADILWHNAGDGRVSLWLMDGLIPKEGSAFPWKAEAPWGIRAIGDFDGDGRDDVILHNTGTGQVAVWLMEGFAPKAGGQIAKAAPGPGCRLVAAGDFDGDGKTDICWNRPNDGQVVFWRMDGLQILAESRPQQTVAVPWRIRGTGDLDGNGIDDLVLRNRQTGAVAAWLMDGLDPVDRGRLENKTMSIDFELIAVADYDGDGRSDLCWRRAHDGQAVFWFMDGFAVVDTAESPWSAAPPWRVVR